ncbi:MAG: class I SAM-dependent methyltransferase [Pirellulaceae bacterium]
MKYVDWYDYPQYFDLAFRDETALEIRFFEAAFAEHAQRPVRTVFEPGCGSGRLVVGMAAKGYQVTGLDLNQASLAYLRRKLRRRKLTAKLDHGDMTRFSLPKPVDAAFCTFNTFRHLLTEQQALAHLHAMSQAIQPGGLYILGFHIIPLDADEDCIERWKAKHAGTEVSITLAVIDFNRRIRREQMRATIKATRKGREKQQVIRCQTEFPLRLYTADQVESMLAKVESFEIAEVYDFDYDIEFPRDLDDDLTDALFVLRRV